MWQKQEGKHLCQLHYTLPSGNIGKAQRRGECSWLAALRSAIEGLEMSYRSQQLTRSPTDSLFQNVCLFPAYLPGCYKYLVNEKCGKHGALIEYRVLNVVCESWVLYSTFFWYSYYLIYITEIPNHMDLKSSFLQLSFSKLKIFFFPLPKVGIFFVEGSQCPKIAAIKFSFPPWARCFSQCEVKSLLLPESMLALGLPGANRMWLT